MTSLNIQQSTQSSETVSSAVIEKLYNLAIISTVEDENSTFEMSLTGSIYANAAYETSVLYLREKFPNLTITIRDNNFYIKFADRNVERVLVASQYCSDGVGFSLSDASLMTTIPKGLFNGTSSGITTFNELNRFGAISIANEAFYGNSTLTSINLSTVTSIGQQSFRNCTNLSQSLNIPNLVSIDYDAFRGCSSISSVASLGNTITSISGYCFSGCSSLTSVNLPQSVTNLGNYAFENCSNLTSIDFSNIAQIGAHTFYNSGLSGQISLPSLTGDLSGGAFRFCSGITSVTSLGTITSICKDARNGYAEGSFTGCTALTSVTIPNTVTIIGTQAFDGCTNLSQVNYDWSNLVTIKALAFSRHANWNFIINLANLTTLGSGALGNTRGTVSVKQVYLPKIVHTNKDGYYSNNAYYYGCFTGLTSDVIYLRDLEDLHPGDFCFTNCSALVINNITPPVWKNTNDMQDSEITNNAHSKIHVFANSTINNIYVPDSAVNTYTSDSDWSTVADKIKPLSQLTKVATEADLQQGQIALIEAYM